MWLTDWLIEKEQDFLVKIIYLLSDKATWLKVFCFRTGVLMIPIAKFDVSSKECIAWYCNFPHIFEYIPTFRYAWIYLENAYMSLVPKRWIEF